MYTYRVYVIYTHLFIRTLFISCATPITSFLPFSIGMQSMDLMVVRSATPSSVSVLGWRLIETAQICTSAMFNNCWHTDTKSRSFMLLAIVGGPALKRKLHRPRLRGPRRGSKGPIFKGEQFSKENNFFCIHQFMYDAYMKNCANLFWISRT